MRISLPTPVRGGHGEGYQQRGVACPELTFVALVLEMVFAVALAKSACVCALRLVGVSWHGPLSITADVCDSPFICLCFSLLQCVRVNATERAHNSVDLTGTAADSAVPVVAVVALCCPSSSLLFPIFLAVAGDPVGPFHFLVACLMMPPCSLTSGKI